MKIGPNLLQENLLFGYDTGYGVANKNTGTRFYAGEDTTNLIPLTTFNNASNWTGGGWSGGMAYSTEYDNTLEFTVTNGWRTFAIDHGVTSGGTISVSFEYQLKSQQTSGIFGLVLNGLNLGNFHNNLGNISNASLEAGGWQTYNGSFTANNNTYGSKICIGLRGTDAGGLTDVLCIRKLQVEQKTTATPYTETSRSSTQSLIDLKKTSSIDVSNMSFSTTNQPTFDGSGDYIDITTDFGTLAQYSFEYVENPQQTHKMPISSRLNTNFYKYGAYSWRYKHGGTLGEYYHTAGATSGWHHWVITYDGSTISVYQDNISLGTNSSSSGSADWSGGLKIGWWSAGGDYDFNGDIPVMKFYDRALTASEVASNFKAYKQRFNI